MSIKNINEINKKSEIDMISGGERQNTLREDTHRIIETLFEENQLIKKAEFAGCINVTKTKYGLTICLPTKKPFMCPYEIWGMLHELPEEIPKC